MIFYANIFWQYLATTLIFTNWLQLNIFENIMNIFENIMNIFVNGNVKTRSYIIRLFSVLQKHNMLLFIR
jgi:hypothetical protein